MKEAVAHGAHKTPRECEANLSTVADGGCVAIQRTVDGADGSAFTGALCAGGGGQPIIPPHPCLARW